MRFLSSVAFERTPRLRFAASCSAAEAMGRPSSVAAYFRLAGRAVQAAFRLIVMPRHVHSAAIPAPATIQGRPHAAAPLVSRLRENDGWRVWPRTAWPGVYG